METVDLGFAEEQDCSYLLTNRYFPSKIGGRVAWLELENIPASTDVNCEYCNEPCCFLCQIYAPSTEKNANAFHRTIFVFVCLKAECCNSNLSGNIKVLRSQLPLRNKFYPDTPPDESIEAEEIASSCKLCNVCGCKAPMVCGKCKKTNYCGQLHQKIDWKEHKKICGKETRESRNDIIHFPQYEIVIEREEKSSKNVQQQETEKEAETRRLHEYDELMKQGDFDEMNKITDKDLQEFAESKEDKVFGKFKKTIEDYPTQVIRYNRHGAPLWISNGGISCKDVPKCQNCTGKRTFEFQIMPQMLNELRNYDLDWGTIAIFTCQNDCDTSGKYFHEYCFKQDISKTEDNDVYNAGELEKLHIKNDKKGDNHDKNNKNELKDQVKNDHENLIQKKLPETSFKRNTKSVETKVLRKAFEESDSWE